MRFTLTPIAALLLAFAALGCGGQSPTPSAAVPAATSMLTPTSTSTATPPTPTPTATPTPQDPSSSERYMAAACRALGEVPVDVREPAPLEQAHAMLQGMSPPDELQDYHATLVELLAFGVRTFDATPDPHLEAEMANRLSAHVVAAQALSPAVFVMIERQCPSDYAEMVGDTAFMDGLTFREDWLNEEGMGERLTREEYLEACPNLLGVNLELDEDPSHDVLEAMTSSLVEQASRVVPPAELVEYHDLLIAYLVLTRESVLAARQQEQDPDDPDARGYVASVYLAFKDLGLALGPTIRLMDPSLKDALAERGCLLEEN